MTTSKDIFVSLGLEAFKKVPKNTHPEGLAASCPVSEKFGCDDPRWPTTLYRSALLMA